MKSYKIKVNGNTYDVTIKSVSAKGVADVIVNGKEQKVEIEDYVAPAAVPSQPSQPSQPAQPARLAVRPFSQADAVRAAAVQTGASSADAGIPVSGCEICSPLPGVITSMYLNVGDRVEAGETVAVLEAMKMENAIEAECGGVVKAVYVHQGDSVLQGAKIVLIG